MRLVGQGSFFFWKRFGLLGLSIVSITAMGAGVSPPAAPVTSSQIKSSLSAAMPEYKDGMPFAQQPSVIEKVKVDGSAKPNGDSELGEAVEFRLNSIQIQGNTIIDEDDIVSLVQPYVGTMIVSTDLSLIAENITQLFVEKGYATSKCIIPAQQVQNGVVTLQVVEDKLGQIQLSGEDTYRYDIGLFLAQLHDLQGKVIHLPTLNNRLLYLSYLPATKVQPTLVKQTEGTTDLVLTLTDLEDRFNISVNNYGNSSTGENQLLYQAVFNNFSGSSDVLSMALATSLNNIKYLGSMSFDYERPFGQSAGKLGMSYSNTYYTVDPSTTTSNSTSTEGGSSSLGLRYGQPLWFDGKASSQKRYSWSAGIEKTNNQAKLFMNKALFGQSAGFLWVDREDRLTVADVTLRTQQDSSIKGFKGNSAVSISIKKSLEGFFGSMTQNDINRELERDKEASEASTGIATLATGPMGELVGMDANFWKLYVDATRTQLLPQKFTAQLNFHGEYTPSKKLPQDYQFKSADGGALGYSLGVKLMRPIAQNAAVGVKLTHSKAISWHRDIDAGCKDSEGSPTVASAGRNTCSENDLGLSVDWSLGDMSATANYDTNLNRGIKNNKITFNLGYGW